MVLPPASQFGPVTGFDPCAFAIINLDRMPPPAADLALDRDDEDAGSVAPSAPVPLTPEQEAALLDLEEAFHSAAAAEAKAMRKAIEAQVADDISRRRKTEMLRQRIAEEKASWQQPSIGVVGWRDAYRAQLAGLPKAYGAHLRWVEKLDAERRRVVLKSGVTITLAPTQARATNAAADTVAVMIAHATTQGWTRVNISGGPEAWRIRMARAATRAGLEVADAALQDVVAAERARMDGQRLLAQWRGIGQTLAAAPLDQRKSLTDAVLQILARIAEHPEVVEFAVDDVERRVLADDLDAYRRYLMSLQEPRSGAGPPRPR
jgi:hypothetical protein